MKSAQSKSLFGIGSITLAILAVQLISSTPVAHAKAAACSPDVIPYNGGFVHVLDCGGDTLIGGSQNYPRPGAQDFSNSEDEEGCW